MNTSLLKLRKLKYERLDHLLGQSVLVSSISEVEQEVLRQLLPTCSEFFQLKTSQKDIAIDIGKHSVLQLTFVNSANKLMVKLPSAPMRLLRELGLLNRGARREGLELGHEDPTGADDVAKTVSDVEQFFEVTLTSQAPIEAIHELVAEVEAELSKEGTSVLGFEASEAAFDLVLQRRVRNAANQFPRTFKVEDAFLSNSGSVYLRKRLYG